MQAVQAPLPCRGQLLRGQAQIQAGLGRACTQSAPDLRYPAAHTLQLPSAAQPAFMSQSPVHCPLAAGGRGEWTGGHMWVLIASGTAKLRPHASAVMRDSLPRSWHSAACEMAACLCRKFHCG